MKTLFLPIGAFCKTGSGTTPSRNKYERYFNGSIPWVKSGELRESIITETEEKVTEEALAETSLKLAPKGSVLVAMYGANVGRVGILGINATTNQAVCYLVPEKDKADSRYLFHALQQKLPEFISRSVGGAQPNISQQIIRETKIPLPPLEEQKRIAEILDQAEELRRKRKEAIAQLDTLTQSIFQDLYYSSQNHLSEISLIDVAEKNRGSFVNGPFGSNLLTSELQEEGVPVIYIRDIKTGTYKRVSKVCVSEKKAKELSVCSVYPKDVLIAKVGDPPGIAAIYPENEPIAIITQDVIRIRIARNFALPEYIVGYLNSSIGRWKISGITIEATRARFSLSDFKKIKIEIPPLSLQKEFAERVEAVEELKKSHRASLSELDALFASLQHRAFKGEL